MRDGMPGPGWWIASDGRWYPPELHPDMRAPATVVVDEPPGLTLSGEQSSTSFDTACDVSNGAAASVAKFGSTNGTPMKARDSNGATATTDSAKAREPIEAIATTGEASRPSRRRLAIGLALALGTLALMIYFARGHDERPSLESRSATNANSTTVASTAVPSVSPTVAPGATASTSTAQAGAAPPTVTSATPATSVPSVSSVTTVTTVTTVPSGGKITPKVVSVFDLVKGDCLDGASLSDGLVTTIRVVDCTDVHTHEVYYSVRYPETVFDATKIGSYANDRCLAQFAPYVGIDYTRSRYQYLHIVPTQDSWTRDNDRDVVCVAFDEDATMVGSIAGRAQ
ncbi:MAG TPA: septum formation family protein [Acidimicrobiales bacterium]|nr:septum formation family protein [Acidimicrobiales bacterium]